MPTIQFIKKHLTIYLCLLLITPFTWAYSLKSGDKHFQIDPTTLKISLLSNKQLITINAGVSTQTVENLTHSANHLQWYWPASNSVITLSINNDDLLLSIKRSVAGNLHWYSMPQSNQLLLMPLSEGMRIDTHDSDWIKYLNNSVGEINTTYDLKIPFWSQQQDDKVFSWLIPAHYNSLTFGLVQQHLTLTASHYFRANESYDVILHLGTDELSGARRYRQLLIDQQQFTTLTEKFANIPQGKRLIGALHSYLFGDALLDTQDIKDWAGLTAYLLSPAAKVVYQHFDQETINILVQLKQEQAPPFTYQQRVITNALNLALNEQFPAYGDANSPLVIEQQYQGIQQQQNWLDAHLASFIQARDRRGQGVSVPVIDALQKAGLLNMWLGVNKWTSAFAQPQAIETAKAAGYLIGPYDSYNTAIAKGLNDTWLSARLPDAMANKCAVVKADGSKQLGFQKNGYYLNPNCDLKAVQQRINDIMRLGKFNSYFIDVDATAMVRDDFNPNNRTSAEQMTQSYNERMQWIANQHKTVLGSEDGNALTQGGVMFAHGMETTGFGWRDKDMRKNRQSPYYLGRWYPDHKPDFFFKSAKVKAPFNRLLFSPENRLPLYQAVYHDALINSHHWTMDNLKFSDVKSQRDLIGMLYNTPPMVNLSRDGLTKRIKALQHYQQGFSPAHQQLWNTALLKLVYLSEDKLLQQTQFSDGSKITANFSEQARKVGEINLPAYSVLTQLANGPQYQWQSQ